MRYEALILDECKLCGKGSTMGEAMARAWVLWRSQAPEPHVTGWVLKDNGVVILRCDGPLPKPNAEWLKTHMSRRNGM